MGLPNIALSQETLSRQIDQVLSGLDFSPFGDLRITVGEENRTIEETARAVAGGEVINPQAILAQVMNLFAGKMAEYGELMLCIMLPALLYAVLQQTFSLRADNLRLLGKNACFFVILIPLILLVIGELEGVREAICETTTRMDQILPLLLTLLTAVGGSASSAFFHPVVIAASGSMVFLAREVVLRLVMCACAVTTINHLSDRAHLTRLARLIRSAVCWLLGVSFTVFLGAMSIQGVCSASIDGVAIRAAKYAVDNFVPVVGGMFSDTMDTLVGCTLIVKNALGVTSVLLLGGVLLGPMIRTLAAIAVLKVCAALLEPVAQAEVVQAIGDFSGTMVLFFITMLCVGSMYFLLIAQLLLVGNLTALLR